MSTLARGALAGLAGTAAMSATQALEMRVTGRKPSTVPGQVGATLLPGLTPDAQTVERLSPVVHWGHGVAMGMLRGLLGDGAGRGALHFALLWGGDAVLYRALGIAGLPWTWSRGDIAIDVLHKGVYGAVTNAAFVRLGR